MAWPLAGMKRKKNDARTAQTIALGAAFPAWSGKGSDVTAPIPATWARFGVRQGATLAILVLFLWVIREQVLTLDVDAIWRAVAGIATWQWVGALIASAGSFAALANYDALVHRAMKTGQNPTQARRSGWIAIALSQTLGFGLISGALVRWRMLPGFSLIEASRLTAVVTASFLLGWVMVTASVLLMFPTSIPWIIAPLVVVCAACVVLAGCCLMGASLWGYQFRFGRWTLRLPPIATLGRVFGLTILDTVLAACALWLLLPAETQYPFIDLYPAFLLALGAGLISGTPGGVGPFEVALVALVPDTDTHALLGAILAWRIVYYALPAILAMGALVLGAPAPTPAPRGHIAPPAPELTPRLAQLADQSPLAEFTLLRQGEHAVLLSQTAQSGWMLGTTSQSLVALRDPAGRKQEIDLLLRDLRAEARIEGRLPCLYKVSARTAAHARGQGWHVLPIAEECWLPLHDFSMETPRRAGLRRKLRKAQKAGVRCEICLSDPPFTEMARIAQDWKSLRGGERGFSMGRYTPEYVAGQTICLAWRDTTLIGFATFHTNPQEWALDLMRPSCDAPDGTMQALIHTAILAAQAEGCPRLSLAALPPRAQDSRAIAALVWRRAEKEPSSTGLRQFKMGFAPRLSPLYLAAPSRWSLGLAGADIARAIRTPPALCAASPDPTDTTSRPRAYKSGSRWS
ncbi:DUF2156 domain-containing protein [Rhodobacteraceae bacterium]|nr:DUF2156 domain-containing protein [Paracoccaceae bacterium]